MSRLDKQLRPEILCPVGCGRNVLGKVLMCSVCWFRVPEIERKAVSRTWRAYLRGKHDRNPTAVLALIREYNTARDVAIASARAANPYTAAHETPQEAKA